MSNNPTGTCPFHEDRETSLNGLKKVVYDSVRPELNEQKGYWKIAFIVLGVFATIMMTFAGLMWKNLENMREDLATTQLELRTSVSNIDKTFTAYISGHVQETANINRQLDYLHIECKDLKQRVRTLENDSK